MINGVELAAGDGAAIRDESVIRVSASDTAELVLVDVAG